MSEATVISSDGRFTVKARQNGDDAPASWLLADSVAGVSFRLALVSEARAVVDNLENMAQAVRDKAAGAVRVELREMTVGHAQGSFLVDVHYDDGQRLTCGIAAGPDADGLNSLLVLCGVDPAVAIAVGKPY